MSRRRVAPDGFAELATTALSRTWPPDTFVAEIAAAIEKARGHTRARQDRLDAARAKTEASRRAEEKKRRERTKQWTVARAKLIEAVLVVDRAIASECMALSMIDAETHPADLAAVEVRASVLGRPVPALLQIVVGEDLSLRARIVDAEVWAPPIKVHAALKVEAGDFGDVLLTYLECALPRPERQACRICRTCGCSLPA